MDFYDVFSPFWNLTAQSFCYMEYLFSCSMKETEELLLIYCFIICRNGEHIFCRCVLVHRKVLSWQFNLEWCVKNLTRNTGKERHFCWLDFYTSGVSQVGVCGCQIIEMCRIHALAACHHSKGGVKCQVIILLKLGHFCVITRI